MGSIRGSLKVVATILSSVDPRTPTVIAPPSPPTSRIHSFATGHGQKINAERLGIRYLEATGAIMRVIPKPTETKVRRNLLGTCKKATKYWPSQEDYGTL